MARCHPVLDGIRFNNRLSHHLLAMNEQQQCLYDSLDEDRTVPIFNELLDVVKCTECNLHVGTFFENLSEHSKALLVNMFIQVDQRPAMAESLWRLIAAINIFSYKKWEDVPYHYQMFLDEDLKPRMTVPLIEDVAHVTEVFRHIFQHMLIVDVGGAPRSTRLSFKHYPEEITEVIVNPYGIDDDLALIQHLNIKIRHLIMRRVNLASRSAFLY